jgi:hypothetical protein
MPLGLGLCGNCCTTPTCGQICTIVEDSCAPNPMLTGATVTVSKSGSVVGSCVTTGQVTSVTQTASGSGFTSLPTPNFSAGAGSGATGTVTMGGVSGSVVTGGTGYAAGLTMTVVGGTRTTAMTLFINSAPGGVVSAVTVSTVGSYTALPTNPVTVTGGGGSGATFNLTWKVATTAVTANGSGYTANFAVTYSGGGGSGATGTAVTQVRCCVPITSAGTTGQYTSVSAKTGYDSKTTTFGAVTCAGSTTTNSTVLLDATGKSCLGCTLTGCPGLLSLASTLYFSDGLGTVACTYRPASDHWLACGWYGCALRPTDQGYDKTCPTVASPVSGNVLVHFNICCNVANQVSLSLGGSACNNLITNAQGTSFGPILDGNCIDPIGSYPHTFGVTIGTATINSCSPFSCSGTFNVLLSGDPGTYSIYGGSISMSCSE